MTKATLVAIRKAGVIVLLVAALTGAHHTDAQPTLPPCGERPTATDEPWNGYFRQFCVEVVLRDDGLGAVGLTSITVAEDGSLYAVAPQRGTLYHLTDTDDDSLPDALTRAADGLTFPTGVAADGNTIWVVGRNHLYAYDRTRGALRVAADDIPAGVTGYPTGGPFVTDEGVYVGAGGTLDCQDTARGAVYRYDRATMTRETVATGITSPADFAQQPGTDQLWVVDTHGDRLFPLEAGRDYGACDDAAPAPPGTVIFEAGAAPVGVAAHTESGLGPVVDNRLLVALRGSVGSVIVPGYAVTGVAADGTQDYVLPTVEENQRERVSRQKMHIQGSGFWPHHVYDVAAAPNGWVYVVVGRGQVYALRES